MTLVFKHLSLLRRILAFFSTVQGLKEPFVFKLAIVCQINKKLFSQIYSSINLNQEKVKEIKNFRVLDTSFKTCFQIYEELNYFWSVFSAFSVPLEVTGGPLNMSTCLFNCCLGFLFLKTSKCFKLKASKQSAT